MSHRNTKKKLVTGTVSQTFDITHVSNAQNHKNKQRELLALQNNKAGLNINQSLRLVSRKRKPSSQSKPSPQPRLPNIEVRAAVKLHDEQRLVARSHTSGSYRQILQSDFTPEKRQSTHKNTHMQKQTYVAQRT